MPPSLLGFVSGCLATACATIAYEQQSALAAVFAALFTSPPLIDALVTQ